MNCFMPIDRKTVLLVSFIEICDSRDLSDFKCNNNDQNLIEVVFELKTNKTKISK